MKRFGFCVLLASGILVLLSACGFHLRGSQDLSPMLAAVSIDNQLSDTVLSTAVEQVLGELGYSAVAEEKSQLVLTLYTAQYEKRVLSIGSLGKAQEFELGYLVQYSLSKTGAKKALLQDTLNLKRDMSYDVSQALGKSKEEYIIKRELLEQAARHMVRRIQYLSAANVNTTEQAPGDINNPNDSAE